MQKTLWLNRLWALAPYVFITVVLTLIFTGIDRIRMAQASVSTDSNPSHAFSAPPPQPCGTQLGAAGYSVTLADKPQADIAFQKALGLQSTDLVPEFQSISGSATALQADANAHALGLDRMYVVNTSHLTSMTPQATLDKLQGQPNVMAAEQVWLQSSDRKYLSCDYKLHDNSAAQSVAGLARAALIAHGVSAALLDDAGTMEFVSERHFNGQSLIQVAFVRRPVGESPAAYVALLSPDGKQVLAVALANWYTWSE